MKTINSTTEQKQSIINSGDVWVCDEVVNGKTVGKKLVRFIVYNSGKMSAFDCNQSAQNTPELLMRFKKVDITKI